MSWKSVPPEGNSEGLPQRGLPEPRTPEPGTPGTPLPGTAGISPGGIPGSLASQGKDAW